MLEDGWQHHPQVFGRFDIIVQYNNRPRPGVAQHIITAFLWCDGWVEITAQYIPHNQAVLTAEFFALASAQAAIRWSKQFALYPMGAFLYIFEVSFVGRFPAIEVIVGMISYRMTILKNLPVNFRMFAHIFADTKKSGFCFVTSQDFEYPGREFGNWTVVKSEV